MDKIIKKSRPLAPHGGEDRVYTPDSLASAIVAHYKPTGKILEPCAGKGAFLRAMPTADWCEIDLGRDFLTKDETLHYDWIVTNLPWSLFRPFLKKSMIVSDNIVFLCLVNAFFMKARMRDMEEAGFGMVEIAVVNTPPKPWPQAGFLLGRYILKKSYIGRITLSKIPYAP